MSIENSCFRTRSVENCLSKNLDLNEALSLVNQILNV
jgi:hypothetical protein